MLAKHRCAAYAGLMALMTTLNPRIVEALYAEALGLAETMRERFETLRRETAEAAPGNDEDLRRVQVSCEALRTTTRVMHCLAWLLNHRAHFAGELSELQLRRHGRLIAGFPASETDLVETLPPDVQAIVHESERLYQRIQRLERAWRRHGMTNGSAVLRLRERLSRAVDGAPSAA